MILVDANLLLRAYDAASEHHARARAWLEDVLSGSDPVGFAWATLLAFLRIATNPRALERPLAIPEAAAIVSAWLAQPCATLVEPASGTGSS